MWTNLANDHLCALNLQGQAVIKISLCLQSFVLMALVQWPPYLCPLLLALHQEACILPCIHTELQRGQNPSLGIRFVFLHHGPAKRQLKPVSAEGDDGWREDHQKHCFLLSRTNMTEWVVRGKESDKNYIDDECESYVWCCAGFPGDSCKVCFLPMLAVLTRHSSPINA